MRTILMGQLGVALFAAWNAFRPPPPSDTMPKHDLSSNAVLFECMEAPNETPFKKWSV